MSVLNNEELERILRVECAKDNFLHAHEQSLKICNPVDYAKRQNDLVHRLSEFIEELIEGGYLMDRQIEKIQRAEKFADKSLKKGIKATGKLLKMDKKQDKKLKKAGIKPE